MEVHIIEVGTNLVAALSSVDISQLERSSLIHSSYTIINAVQSKCDIAAWILVTEPPFQHVFEELLSSVNCEVKLKDTGICSTAI